ncbi:MAG: response regulator transcription factor [Clostridium sp.]|uniref:response regulator transcription factor n=1 Tax=Clostridium sp. TaxID=1506 RepID=UPI00303B310C
MEYKLLIIEDDIDIAIMVKEYLRKEGYEIFICNTGEEGLEVLKSKEIDLILLDVMMPGIDGYETLSKIRAFSELPVIMITARGHQLDKVIGFKKGCDDYVVKPFDLVELNLRILAILRRAKVVETLPTSQIKYKDLIIDKEAYKVTKDEGEIKLTKKEFYILLLLMENQGKVYTTEIIYNLIWKEEYIENDNSVITHIRNLRDKIGDRVKESIYIKTIWGVGYKVEKEN